jgi:hypothetical protein
MLELLQSCLLSTIPPGETEGSIVKYESLSLSLSSADEVKGIMQELLNTQPIMFILMESGNL